MYGYEQTASAGHGHPHGGQQYVHQGQPQGHQQAHQGHQAPHQQPHQQYAPQQDPPPPYGQQPLYPEPSPPSLTEAVRAFTTGSMGPEDFQGIFSTSKVYCPRGDTPGFLALHNTQQPVIPMFSTLKELRRYAGKESRYFVITGAEVLDLLPSGYGFVLDMEGEHRVVFDAKAVEEMVDFAMRSMYG